MDITKKKAGNFSGKNGICSQLSGFGYGKGTYMFVIVQGEPCNVEGELMEC